MNAMTSQEQQWLDEFLQRLAAAQGVAKDPQADALIRERLAAQPDASYLLVQRALLLERALHDARQQIAQLQQQAQGQGSFLGQGLDTQFGRNPGAAPSPTPAYAAPAYAAAPPAQPGWRERLFGGPAAAANAAAPAAAGSSFLGHAAASAAGVAGGMFLFNGLENLLGHHGTGSGWPGGGNSPQVLENVTQNFYDDGQNQAGLDQLARESGGDAGLLRGSDDFDSTGGFFDDDDDSFA